MKFEFVAKMTNVFHVHLFLCGLLGIFLSPVRATYPYYGTKIGALTQLHHAVSGEVYAVDSRTLFIKNFNYDGEAPAAYFYVGNTPKPSNEGAFRLRDERGSTAPLIKRYRNKNITLSLPEGKTLKDIKWFSVWCDEFAVNFGDVKIPENLDFPKPQKLTPLNGVHGVSSDNIVAVDAQTLLVPNFSYDGEAPDAKFWVGRGSKPTPQGLRIPDENGKETPLRRYDRKTIVLTLPGDLTIFDIGHFGVWCEAFTVDFGHIRVPDGLNIPPSLKMLGISPQSKLNCEVLYDELAFEVRWAVAGESVVVQLVSKLEDGEYMSFGISPNLAHSEMVGADVVVAWVDKETGKGFAYDYYLDDKSQCSGTRGSCPDSRISANTNSIRLLNAAMVNGYSIVTYQRSLKAADELDLPIHVNDSQAIVWAIGPLNGRNEVSFHSKYTKGDKLINFGRQPKWNCPMPEEEIKSKNQDSEEFYEKRPQAQVQTTTTARPQTNRRGSLSRPQRGPVPTPSAASTKDAWEIPPIQCNEPDDGVFYAQMGPTGGKHGYPAITGHVGWGISWYINGLLIPEIHVVRGKTYTFVTEGGNDPEIPAKYHPFYITDDPIGGYEHKTEEEKKGIKIFAGVHKSRTGKLTPIGVGRLCNWIPDPDSPPADEFQSFGAYQRTLTLKCDVGEPGIISWTPDKDTPDEVYYHCFTHRYLGWKIHVHDECDADGLASEIEEVYAEPEDEFLAEASIRYETKVRPNEIAAVQNEKDLIKNHNMNGTPPKLSFEITKSSEITKLIADGIRAAEALEESITKKPHFTMQTLPHKPISEVLMGETVLINNLTTAELNDMVHPNPDISTFLTPPQNIPLFRPSKLPGKRPIPLPNDRFHLARPGAFPQSSVKLNYYRKPMPPIAMPIMKEPLFPGKLASPILLLGQPTELGVGNSRHTESLQKNKPKLTSIPVPYIDSSPQSSKKPLSLLRNGINSKHKKTVQRYPVLPQKEVNKNVIEPNKEFVSTTFKQAVNTGFQPDSVVVEGGFRPIVQQRNEENLNEYKEKEASRRQDSQVSEVNEAQERDALFYLQDDKPQSFEPMFIPSPPDSTNAYIARKPIESTKTPSLSGDLIDMEVEEGDDKVAVAAERLDTIYFSPNSKARQSVLVPDGAVVTYDGKAVIDMLLVNNAPQTRTTEVPKGVSKTEQLVRSTPQFGPFKGEMPPPVPDHLPKDAPQNNPTKNAPSPKHPITEYSNPLSLNTTNINPISTKLTLLKIKNKSEARESVA